MGHTLRDHCAPRGWPAVFVIGLALALWQVRFIILSWWNGLRSGAPLSGVPRQMVEVLPIVLFALVIAAFVLLALAPVWAWLLARMSARLRPVRFVLGTLLAYWTALILFAIVVGGFVLPPAQGFASSPSPFEAIFYLLRRYTQAAGPEMMVMLPGAILWQWLMRDRRRRDRLGHEQRGRERRENVADAF